MYLTIVNLYFIIAAISHSCNFISDCDFISHNCNILSKNCGFISHNCDIFSHKCNIISHNWGFLSYKCDFFLTFVTVSCNCKFISHSVILFFTFVISFLIIYITITCFISVLYEVKSSFRYQTLGQIY